MAGRFAQARGNSAWAQAFNANLNQQRRGFVNSAAPSWASSYFRPMSAVTASLSQCMGESPQTGFAEQYRCITNSVNTLGQSGSAGDAVAGDAEAQVVAGSVAEELEFVQIAEVPTLFTYCHHQMSDVTRRQL